VTRISQPVGERRKGDKGGGRGDTQGAHIAAQNDDHLKNADLKTREGTGSSNEVVGGSQELKFGRSHWRKTT